MNKACAGPWKISTIALPFWLLGISACIPYASCADQAQDILGSNGDTFMEEAAPAPKPRKQGANARANIISSDGSRSTGTSHSQNVQDTHKGIFMEEVDGCSSHSEPRKAYVDLSNVGIQVDPSGNAVPLIDHSRTPVRPIYSNTQAFQEMPVPMVNQTYDNPLALPYTMNGQPAAVGTSFAPVTPGMVPFLQPSYSRNNNMTTLNPYSASPYPTLVLPMPTQKTYSSSYSGSNLITPFLRDPATSTGDLPEDAKRGGLWSNSAGSGSGVLNQGLLGGSYKGTSEQHDTGITDGPGIK